MTDPSKTIEEHWALVGSETLLSHFKYSPLPKNPFLDMEDKSTPEEKQANHDFALLQERIANIPQELQDQILRELIKLHLLRGRVLLDGCRCHSWHLSRREHKSNLCNSKNYFPAGDDRIFRNIPYEAFKAAYARPDFTIFSSLNKDWTKTALEILLLGNSWIMGVSCFLNNTYIHESNVRSDRRSLVAAGDRGVWLSCIEFYMGCKNAAYQVQPQEGGTGHLRLWTKEKYNLADIGDMHGLLEDCALENYINICDDSGDEELDCEDHIWRREGSVKIPWTTKPEDMDEKDKEMLKWALNITHLSLSMWSEPRGSR